jgi:CheY-like chemotaxis protein
MQTHENKSAELRYRLGGARADFVASLGRKIADARTVLIALGGSRGNAHLRSELMRRLAAMAQGANILRFPAMEQGLAEALALLHRVSHEGELTADDVDTIGQMLEDLPALAWGEAPRRGGKDETQVPPPAAERTTDNSHSVMIVGSPSIADALTYHDPDGLSFSCENTEDAQAAIDVARALAPDVIVLDADVKDAAELAMALMDDPMTDAVPIVVIGTFMDPGSRESYVAMGVSKVLSKPLPHERLRRACEESVFTTEGRTMRVVLGEPTVQQLGDRLADEVRQALVSAVEESLRGQRVPLGEGTEVLGAVWGAIARVREVVTARTSGVVRFNSQGPEGAIALAPSLDTDGGLGLRGAGHLRGASAADVRLAGRTILVCDDDPGVVWFISDLLKAAGCTVIEAHDGEQALALAWKHVPDVVVSDILMPKLDGFALTRRLKRDVVLRDVPVVLLSWKEDLLQRVRELGAGASAYLRKESDARAMVSRIRESLRPKTRVETRLRSDGEIRGRLDGITVRSLLDTVCRTRDNARVSIRDASFLYEVEIRDGAPARATRTAGDGSFMNGPKVLASMLGVSAARFVVAPSTGVIAAELVGELSHQLARPIAVARASQALTSGQELLRTAALVFDDEGLADYLKATPEREKKILAALKDGASPRDLLDNGTADIGGLSDLLLDLGARGVITRVEQPKGIDVLAPAVEAALRLVDSKSRGLIGTTPSPLHGNHVVAALKARIAKAPAAVVMDVTDVDAATAQADAEALEAAHDARVAAEAEGSDRNDALAMGEPSPSPAGLKEPEPTDIEQTFFEEGDAPKSYDSVSVSIRMEPPSSALRHDTPLESVKVKDAVGERETQKRWPLLFGMTAAVGVAALAFYFGRGPIPAVQSGSNGSEAPQAEVAGEVTYVDMPAGARVEPGQGVLEVIHEGKDGVRVDGLDRGAAANLSLPLWAGNHDVRAGAGDSQHAKVVEVRPGKIARVKLFP